MKDKQLPKILAVCFVVFFLVLLFLLKNESPATGGHIERLKNRNASLEDRIDAANKAGELQVAEAVEPLTTVASDESENINLRYTAVRSLGLIKEGNAIPVLSSLFLDPHQDEHLRIVAALALGNLGGDEATNALSQGLQDGNADIRFKALQGLERTGEKYNKQYIISSLKDSDKHVRAMAIEALGKIGDVSDVPIIDEILNNTEDNFIKIWCLGALGDLGGVNAREILQSYTSNPNDLLRLNAARSAAKYRIRE